MLNVIFHNIQDASFKFIKKLDVANIRQVYYYKMKFNIFDKKNNYMLVVLHDAPYWNTNSISFVSYPTERRCKNERDEIRFKQNALNNYTNKIRNEILPRNFSDVMYDLPMANFEFIILPNISHGRPSFAVSFLNKESNLLIITLCGKYFHQKCPNAVIIERRGNNDANIISMVADMKFQVVVLDDCFYDAIDADALLRKVKLLQIKQEFKILVFSQYASLIIHKMDLPKASIVWLPENYRHTSLNSNNLKYYNNASIDQ